MKTELTINVRPVRHVYFINANDLERFREVASYCCTQWGGINNLIIPVNSAKDPQGEVIFIHPYLDSMIVRRHPDVFVDAIPNNEENSQIHDELRKYLSQRYPGQSFKQWDAFIQLDDAFHPLNILSFQTDTSKREVMIPGFLEDFSPPMSELENAMLTAAFGKIWFGQEKEYKERYIFKEWDAAHPDLFFYRQTLVDPHASIINLTLKELHNIGTENAFPSLYFDVVIVRGVWDLCWFWNLRAQSFGHIWLADRRTLVVSKEQLMQPKSAYFESLVHLVKERRSHKHIESNIDVVFHHYRDQEVHDFLQSHGEFQRHEGVLQSNMHSEREEDNSEIIYKPINFQEDRVIDLNIYHEYGGSRPSFSQELIAGSETFLVPSAGPRLGGVGTAYIGLQPTFRSFNQRDYIIFRRAVLRDIK